MDLSPPVPLRIKLAVIAAPARQPAAVRTPRLVMIILLIPRASRPLARAAGQNGGVKCDKESGLRSQGQEHHNRGQARAERRIEIVARIVQH